MMRIGSSAAAYTVMKQLRQAKIRMETGGHLPEILPKMDVSIIGSHDVAEGCCKAVLSPEDFKKVEEANATTMELANTYDSFSETNVGDQVVTNVTKGLTMARVGEYLFHGSGIIMNVIRYGFPKTREKHENKAIMAYQRALRIAEDEVVTKIDAT